MLPSLPSLWSLGCLADPAQLLRHSQALLHCSLHVGHRARLWKGNRKPETPFCAGGAHSPARRQTHNQRVMRQGSRWHNRIRLGGDPVKGGSRLLEKARGMDSPGGLPRGGGTTWVWLEEQECIRGDKKNWEGGERHYRLKERDMFKNEENREACRIYSICR